MIFSYFECFIVIGVILLMIIPGYVIRKKKMVDDQAISVLSVVLLYVCQPFITIKAFALSDVEATTALVINMLIMFALSFVIYIIIFIVIKIVFKYQKDKLKAGAYMICSLFSNASFIGVVFVEIMTRSHLAIIYGAIFMTVFNILIWTIGVFFITGEIKLMKPLRGLLNPAVFVLIIALPLFFFPSINIFKQVKMLEESVKFFAYSCLPISMIIVGIRMADLPIKSIFCNLSLYIVSLFKLIIAPLLSILILLPLLIFDIFQEIDIYNYIIIVIVTMMALPCAATCIAMTEQFHGDVNTTVDGFILTTLLSIFTIPGILICLLKIIDFFRG